MLGHVSAMETEGTALSSLGAGRVPSRRTRPPPGPARLHYGWVVAAWAAGAAREASGDYAVAFTVAGVLAVAAALLSQGVARGGHLTTGAAAPAPA